MPTKQETRTICQLLLMIANAYDENRKDYVGYADGEMRPEFTLAELRPTANAAVAEAQKMLASWGGK